MMSIINLLNPFKLPDGSRNKGQKASVSGSQKPSDTNNPPPNDTASSNVAVNILAFRTITTLLAQLPRTNAIPAIDNLDKKTQIQTQVMIPDAIRREIKISDAFAHLAAGEHDVVALTTNYGHLNPELAVMLSLNKDASVVESPPIQPPPATHRNWPWIFTRNVLADDEESFTASPHPTIISSSEPDNLGGRSAYAYMAGLEQCWIKPSLSNHLWILSNVLTGTGRAMDGRRQFQPDLCARLLRYTAATSYRKMARRFKNKALSMPYLESLKRLGVKDIPIISPTISPPKSDADIRRILDEIDNDRLFLKDFVMPYTECPDTLRTQIPNLIKMANDMPLNNDAFQLYTDETRTEFHLLLLELLDRFEAALNALIALDRDKAAQGSDQAVKQFNENVDDLYQVGYALLKLSRGHAFQRHLTNIKDLLDDPRSSIAGTSIEEEDDEEHDKGEDEEEIDDLEAIRYALLSEGVDHGRKALLKSYVAWLRLMVGHFDAVEILFRHVTSESFPYDSISISILVAPAVGTALLDWPRLFKENILPKTSSGSVHQVGITNDEIYAFLIKGISMAEEARDARLLARQALTLWKKTPPEHKKTIKILKKLLQSTSSEAVKNQLAAIITKVSNWKDQPEYHLEANCLEITNNIKALMGNLSDTDRFYLNLKNTTFKGTLHCEASLASLLPAFTKGLPIDDSKYKEIEILSKMEGFGQAIGVSKRCCPACVAFLKYLMTDRQGDFFVRGSHGTISPCTLPPWTPTNIVDQMNGWFGLRLRDDLVTLMSKPNKSFRNRCKSTGSETLSLDSSEGSGGGFSSTDFPKRIRQFYA